MSYKVYAGIQTAVDTWSTKVCIYDPGDQMGVKKLISPTLTREAGKAGSFEFTIPLGNVAHSALQKLRTVVEVRQDDQLIWQGRVMSHEQDFMLRQKTYCEGELAYTNDSCVAPYTAKNVSFSEFLRWICDNHNGQVDAYKAFQPGRVEMDKPFLMPCLYGCTIKHDADRTEDHDDHEHVYRIWHLYDPSGNVIDGWSEEVEDTYGNGPSALSYTIGEEHYVESSTYGGGYLMSRTGENQFRIRLNAIYDEYSGKTYTASVSIKQAMIDCVLNGRNFGNRAVFNMGSAYENGKVKITKSQSTYTVAIGGTVDPRYVVEKNYRVYDFSPDGTDVNSTWNTLQNALIEKYGGYLYTRHEKNANGTSYRYLDYLQDVPDKNDQCIEFGSNLLDLTSYVKAEDIITRVIAVGKQTTGWFLWTNVGVITATANDVEAQKIFGIITKVLVIDGESSTPQSLQDAADAELGKNLRYVDGMTVKAVDLKDAGIDIDRIAFGKKTHIRSAPHGVDTWLLCSKLVETLDEPDKKTFTFGVEFSSISDLQALSVRKAGEAYDLSRMLKGYAMNKG